MEVEFIASKSSLKYIFFSVYFSRWYENIIQQVETENTKNKVFFL